MPEEKSKLQDKVKGLYDRIGSEFYLSRDDFEANGERYNSTLLFGALTELNRGNMLLFGEYGGGKTTSAEYLQSVFNGLPLDLVKRVAIRGNPQLTEEKMVGRPHYGKMHQGKEEKVGRVKNIQLENKSVNEAVEGDEVAISIPGVNFERQMKNRNFLYSNISESQFKNLKRNKDLLSQKEIGLLQEIAEVKRQGKADWGN